MYPCFSFGLCYVTLNGKLFCLQTISNKTMLYHWVSMMWMESCKIFELKLLAMTLRVHGRNELHFAISERHETYITIKTNKQKKNFRESTRTNQ